MGTERIKVLRAMRIPLDPTVGERGMYIQHIDTLEIEWPDGTREIYGRSTFAEGSIAASVLGEAQWWRSHRTFEGHAEHEAAKERAIGALAGEPFELTRDEQPESELGPIRLKPVDREACTHPCCNQT